MAILGLVATSAAVAFAGSAQGLSIPDHPPAGATIEGSPRAHASEARIASQAVAAATAGDQSFALVPASVDGAAPPTEGLAESLGGLMAWVADQSSGRYRLAARLTPPVALSGGVCWALGSLTSQARAQTAIPEQHVGVVTAERGCGYAGLGGGGALHLNGYTSKHILRHEYGHILGMGHANSGLCSNLADMSTCQVEEYGDRLDVMGSDREVDGLTAAMRDKLEWGEAIEPGAGGEFVLPARRYLKVKTARGAYFVEWLDRQMTTDKWVCNRTCSREVVSVKGMGVQAEQAGSSGLPDTVRPLPEPGRYVWNAGEEFHAPGIFRVSGREGVVAFRWDDTTAPTLAGDGRGEDWEDGTWRASIEGSDGGSGVARFDAAAAEGQPPWGASADIGEFSVPNGVRAISVVATDRAGNRSAPALVRAPRTGPRMVVRIGGAKCSSTCRPRATRTGRHTATITFKGIAPASGTAVKLRVQGARRPLITTQVKDGAPVKVTISGVRRPTVVNVRVGASAETTSGSRTIRVVPRGR